MFITTFIILQKYLTFIKLHNDYQRFIIARNVPASRSSNSPTYCDRIALTSRETSTICRVSRSWKFARARFEFPSVSFLVYVPGAFATAHSAMTFTSTRRMRSTPRLASFRATYNVYVSHVYLSWIPRIDRDHRGHAWSRDFLRESDPHRTRDVNASRRYCVRRPRGIANRTRPPSSPWTRCRHRRRRRRSWTSRCRHVEEGAVAVAVDAASERRWETLGDASTPHTGKRGVPKWSPSTTGLLFSFGARISWVFLFFSSPFFLIVETQRASTGAVASRRYVARLTSSAAWLSARFKYFRYFYDK